ncbi:MAG: LptF/LptG family permease [Alphaproteobacteria bacterium]
MKLLARYISRLFLLRFGLLLIGGVALILSFDLLERGDNLIAAVGGDTAVFVRYAVLRFPDIALQLMPIAALLGAILTLGDLLRHRELLVIWSTGVSPFGLIRGLLPAGLLIVAGHFAISNWAVPASAVVLRAWNVGPYKDSGLGYQPSFWVRSDTDLVRVPTASALSGNLENLTIFRRDADGMLIERLDAHEARQSQEGLLLIGVTRRSVEPLDTSTHARLRWEGRLETDKFSLLSRGPRELRITEIRNLIVNEAYGQRPTELYRTWLHYRMASALGPVLMILLAISLLQGIRRARTFGWLLVFGVSFGFGFFVFDNIALAIGEVGFLPPWMAAWAPTVILLCLVGSFLLRPESRVRFEAPMPTPDSR